MITQEQIDAMYRSAQYIDNYGQRMAELEEIRRLQEILTPRPVVVAKPMQTMTSTQPRKTVAERLAEQSQEKLASGKYTDPKVIAFLTAMSKVHSGCK